MSEAADVARAIDAVRRGWPIRIEGADGALDLLAVETADDGRLARFGADGQRDLILSSTRAATLKLANQADAARPGAARIGAAPWLDLAAATALADPVLDLAAPLKGPYRAVPVVAEAAALAALELARLAGVLPAFFAAPHPDPLAAARAAAVLAYASPARLEIAARARLPIAASEQTEIVAFRSADEAVEHVALLIGTPRSGTPPLVRLHSECLTGDALGSLKCDCGPQLDAALAAIAAEGWGILLYLRQEGRGIGLVNKLRAYMLQDQGFDTVDANLRLGFAVDSRDFGVAGRMLALLGQTRIRLLTNNPAKVSGLTEAGVDVVERVPLHPPANPHNVGYLATKRLRSGHLL